MALWIWSQLVPIKCLKSCRCACKRTKYNPYCRFDDVLVASAFICPKFVNCEARNFFMSDEQTNRFIVLSNFLRSQSHHWKSEENDPSASYSSSPDASIADQRVAAATSTYATAAEPAKVSPKRLSLFRVTLQFFFRSHHRTPLIMREIIWEIKTKKKFFFFFVCVRDCETSEIEKPWESRKDLLIENFISL